jgi:hypothetical protein
MQQAVGATSRRIIRGVVAHCPLRAQEINAGPPEDATLEVLGDQTL